MKKKLKYQRKLNKKTKNKQKQSGIAQHLSPDTAQKIINSPGIGNMTGRQIVMLHRQGVEAFNQSAEFFQGMEENLLWGQ